CCVCPNMPQARKHTRRSCMAQEKVEAGGHASRVTQEQRWVLGLASAASFIVILDVMVVTTALTAIRRNLGASLADLEWTVNAYTLSFAVLLMTAAAIGKDRKSTRLNSS